MQNKQKITPCLWFESQAEEAANFYVSVFSARGRNSKVGKVTRYPKAAEEVSGKPAGSVMTVEFELDGQKFIAINGGPDFKFSEAVSFVVDCESQEEIDYFWEKLSAGGDPKAQICGWLKDKFGLSWQVVPAVLGELLQDPDPEKAEKAMQAMLKMGKIVIEDLKKA
ncbi:MAG: VOC family protein [Candidatus Moranbacteria bacterium]|nr:VOC family protein [Candidatus Moranbacteria bacterium]